MPQLLPTLLFASSAAASITTSLMMPAGAYDDGPKPSYLASVLGANKGRTTLVLFPDGEVSGIDNDMVLTATATFGKSYFEAGTITNDPESTATGDYTANLQCSFTARSSAACTYSWNGELAHQIMCEDATQQISEYYLTTFTSGTDTVTDTLIHDENVVPDWCTTASRIPEEIAVTKLDDQEGDLYQVIITAGEAKLSATAGDSASTSIPSVTSTPASTGSTAEEPTGSAPSGSQASGAPEETGAAAAVAVPALAGLGAALMQFFL